MDIDARGTFFTEQVLCSLLSAYKEGSFGPRFGATQFAHAKFTGNADFTGAVFEGDADFTDAKFTGNADFTGAVFEGDADFTGVEFSKIALFGEARFNGRAMFNVSTFNEEAYFRAVEFNKSAIFLAARFISATEFGYAADFSAAQFGSCSFGAKFNGRIRFNNTIFNGVADFTAAEFGDIGLRPWILGRCTAKELHLNRVKVYGGVLVVNFSVDEVLVSGLDGIDLRIEGKIQIDAPSARSRAGSNVRYLDGSLVLSNLIFETPATITAPVRTNESREAPRLVSLQGVDATNLRLVGLDLRGCRFLGCHNLDLLRIEGFPQLSEQPAGWYWTKRRVLAEEHLWRARYDRRPAGWFPETCRHPGEGDQISLPSSKTSWQARSEAARIQAVYRDLRKSREDAKDEPGAADFYFGEMEMRRFAASPRSMERYLLTMYWMIAGYGLRGSRALCALLIFVTVGMIGFATLGFEPSTRLEYRPIEESSDGKAVAYRQFAVREQRPGWGAALAFSVENVTSILRTPQPRARNLIGEGIEIALRLLGPVLLGLVIIAVRGRVKR